MSLQTQSKVLQEFFKTAQALMNPEVQNWKESGGKIVGFLCSAVPEEIMTAAGILPFRMRGTGSTGTDMSDRYMSSINCSYCRHTLDLGLKGEYGFLDGVICLNSCDHARRIYDNWKHAIDTPFIEILSFPMMTGDAQVEWYRQELEILKQKMEKHFGVEITDAKLRDAIMLHNETKQLLRQVYEFRKQTNPPITGAQTLAVTVAGTAMPKKRYNEMLQELLNDLDQAEGNGDYRARFLIVGSMLDDPAYLQVIEEQGGLVVADSLCFGSRILMTDVNEDIDDPLTAIAKYYVADRPPCPRMFQEQARRLDILKTMISDFNVDAVISERIVFCDLWLGEHYMMDQDFKKEDIPFLKLEREYHLTSVGQMRTRVQAFIETMGR